VVLNLKKTMEILKEIKDYKGLYKISNLGVIKSEITNKILKNKLNSKGYFCVNLYKNKISKTHTIHRLLAVYFIENLNKYPCVNHIDGNKINNNLNNLEWCSYSENNKHAYDIGLKKMSEYNKKILFKKVIDNNTKIIYNSIKEASIKNNINYTTLGLKLNNRIKNNTNFKFYIENE